MHTHIHIYIYTHIHMYMYIYIYIILIRRFVLPAAHGGCEQGHAPARGAPGLHDAGHERPGRLQVPPQAVGSAHKEGRIDDRA